jgi:hypothetical protein
VDALRAIGCSVVSLAMLGAGVPDILCGRNGTNMLIEIKRDGGRLTPDQEEWHRAWRGTVHLVYTVEQALDVVKHWLPTKP